jgi:alpha-beta hydrolase superfamily lysophospholipase
MTSVLPSELSLSSQLRGIALRDWPLAEGLASRGVVLMVHGLGEHIGRYDALAQQFNAWGFAVRGYDQYGHGASEGPRGGLTSDTRLLDDLAMVVDQTRASIDANKRLVLLGHSMGGLVASRFVSLQMRVIDGLVLSSPALDAGLNPVQRLLVAVLPRLLPGLRVGNGLDARLISHDAAEVAAYLSDPLVHDRISARLARFIADEGEAVISKAWSWTVPTLLLYAGEDKLVKPQGSRRFAALAPPEVLESHCFEALYHELFNEAEPGRAQVRETLRQWMNRRFPG